MVSGCINKTDLTSELILSVWVFENVHTHQEDYVPVHQLAGPPNRPLAMRLWVVTQLPNLSPPSPLLLWTNRLAVHPHHTLLQIASPSHLSRPIINYWWMGRLTRLRDRPERERRAKSRPEGEKSAADRYYLNKLTASVPRKDERQKRLQNFF